MRKVIIIATVVLIFVLLPIAGCYWVIYTPSGLRFALGQADRLKTIVRIEAAGVRGDLASGFHVDRLTIDHERVRIVIDDLKARLHPKSLWLQTIEADDVSAQHIHVEVRPALQLPDNRLKFLPSFLRVVVSDAVVNGVDLVLPNRYRLAGNRISAQVLLTSRRLRVSRLSMDGIFFTAAGSLELGAANPLQLAADLQWTLAVPERAPWRGSARLQGDLNELAVSAEQWAPIRAHIQGHALRLTQDFRWDAQIASAAVQFSQLVPAAKVTAKNLVIGLHGDRAGMDIAGSLTPTNLPTGRLDFTAHGPYPTRHVQFDFLTVRGSGGMGIDARLTMDVSRGGPALDLKGHIRKFRWPMLGTAIVNSSAADFSLAGPNLPYRFSVDGPVNVGKLPPLLVSATGLLDHDRLSLDRFSAQGLKGTLAAQGSLSWVDRREWHFQIDGQNLDPGELRPGSPGRINFSASVDGAGLDAKADFDVRLGRLTGMLRGQPIFATGGIRRHGSRFDLDRFDTHWGSARLTMTHCKILVLLVH